MVDCGGAPDFIIRPIERARETGLTHKSSHDCFGAVVPDLYSNCLAYSSTTHLASRLSTGLADG